MKQIGIGVIGLGSRGSITHLAHRPEKGFSIVAGVDPCSDAVDQFSKELGAEIDCCTHAYELVQRDDIDAVFVCSPDHLHEEHAVAALRAGKAVYVEKPLAISIESCDRIIAAAREYGSKLFIGHNLRYMNLFIKMKEIVDSGRIGEVKAVWCRHFISYGGDAYFHDWHSERKYSNGLLLQKGAHDIDIIHWLAGRYTKRVAAFGSLSVYDKCAKRDAEEKGDTSWNPDHYPPLEQKGFSPAIDVEDQSTVIMDMGDGVLGNYSQCHFSPDACRNYTVIGTEGRIENIGDGPSDPIYIWSGRKLEWEFHNRMLEPDDKCYAGKALDGGHGGADPVAIQEFLDFVRGDVCETTATPEAARMAVAVGCKATESLRSGSGALEVPGLPEGEYC